MPELCKFYGIIIMMYYKEHQPPHFHVKYGEYRGVFTITDLKLTEGYLPKRVISLVLEWAFEHRQDLMKNWDLSQTQKPLQKIQPLE